MLVYSDKSTSAFITYFHHFGGVVLREQEGRWAEGDAQKLCKNAECWQNVQRASERVVVHKNVRRAL